MKGKSVDLIGLRKPRGPEDGIALIVVLWGVALLMMIALLFAGSVQLETRATTDQKEATQAYGIACGGVQAALFEMGYPLPSDLERPKFWTWRAGERQTVVPFPGGRAVLEIVNETGKVDLNFASDVQLQRLFEAHGLNAARAGALAQAILEWRKLAADDDASRALDAYYTRLGYAARHAQFGSVEEVMRVRGMSPEFFYGTLTVTPEGRIVPFGGVRDDLTIFAKTPAVNINYGSAAALESVPGITPDLAAAIIRERVMNGPYRSMDDANLRLSAALPDESVSYLTTAEGSFYSVVAVGEVAGSRVRRVVKALLSTRASGGAPARIVLWYDVDPSEEGIG
ncbi:MAG TPA: helix-hairpin-helix domain-containing protein [Terriglobia bacterium]|nr:helix-hairpin-helix domain-containing protein [Terriglobia bacterium]